MNNSDFKRLLATDDKALVKELTNPQKKKAGKRPPPKGKGKDDDGKGKGKGKGDGTAGGKGGKKSGLEPNQPEYRDRAKERREAKAEYEQIAAEWENHGEVDLEQSKYLGGDVEHTHLVKGLDFALLSKVRNELAKQKKSEELQDLRAARKQPKKRTFETVLAKRIWHTVVETLHPHHKTFEQRLKGMREAISRGQRIRGAPIFFLPGRMEYEFDVDTEAPQGPTDIPRIIYISKEDAPSIDATKKVASALSETVAKVRNCMQRAIEERKKRKHEKILGAAASYTVAQKIVATKHKAKDDDDIFAGVGGFSGAEFAAKEVEEKAKVAAQTAGASVSSKRSQESAAPNAAQAERRASYFDDAGAEKYRKGTDDGQLDLDDVAVDEQGENASGEASAGGDGKEFEASDHWRGARPGWVFKLGPRGLGYYLDDAKLAAKAAATKASADLLAGKSSARVPLRKPKEQPQASRAAGKRDASAIDDDAYGECFPSAMMGHALVMTGEDGSDDEEDESAKKKIEKMKKLADKDSLKSSSYGKKGKNGADEKKRKLSENQEWQKIDNMIKKGKHTSLEELEAKHSRRTPAPREIMATPR